MPITADHRDHSCDTTLCWPLVCPRPGPLPTELGGLQQRLFPYVAMFVSHWPGLEFLSILCHCQIVEHVPSLVSDICPAACHGLAAVIYAPRPYLSLGAEK